jgi:uncharacterized cupredoxin-like copper-binding protein
VGYQMTAAFPDAWDQRPAKPGPMAVASLLRREWTGSMVKIRLLGLAAIPAAVILAGCGSNPATTGQAMGGGAHGMGSGQGMGSGSGYHYSPLTCLAPSSLPGHTVTVTLADMGMTQMGGVAPMGAHMSLTVSSTTVAAGEVSLVASNRGWRKHELLILPLANGATDRQRIPGADGKVDETGNLGEASKSCSSGIGAGIQSGAVGWTTVTLSPGRYELVCNLQNHYADGMHQELSVS